MIILIINMKSYSKRKVQFYAFYLRVNATDADLVSAVFGRALLGAEKCIQDQNKNIHHSFLDSIIGGFVTLVCIAY